MIDRVASAPGKIVLFGEYAVLHNAPAVCMAVNRRAVVSVTAGDGNKHRVTTHGYAPPALFQSGRDGRIVWNEETTAHRLLQCVWQHVAVGADSILHIDIDSRAFRNPRTGNKYGLGSSAAVAVALTAALDPRFDSRNAARAHREFQGDTGSGADIACCSAGGLIEYRMATQASSQLIWPRGLHSAVVWSGVSASTTSQVAKFLARPPRRETAALCAAAENLASCWLEGKVDELLASAGTYVHTLDRFDAAHDLGVFRAGHAALVKAAENHGVVYKPCGAGGGDVGIVLGQDPAAIDLFLIAATDLGFELLDVVMDDNGVQVNEHG